MVEEPKGSLRLRVENHSEGLRFGFDIVLALVWLNTCGGGKVMSAMSNTWRVLELLTLNAKLIRIHYLQNKEQSSLFGLLLFACCCLARETAQLYWSPSPVGFELRLLGVVGVDVNKPALLVYHVEPPQCGDTPHTEGGRGLYLTWEYSE